MSGRWVPKLPRSSRRRPRRRAAPGAWVLVACPSCGARLQLRRADVEGRDLTPWTEVVGPGRLPCPFCIWGEPQVFYALELEPPEGEPRRCFMKGGQQLHGRPPRKDRRTGDPARVGCRACRRILARRAMEKLQAHSRAGQVEGEEPPDGL